MKVVLWIGKGANQVALAHKLSEIVQIEGIVIENKTNKVKRSVNLYAEKLIEKLFFSSISKAWWEMLNFYDQKFKYLPETKTLEVSNINSENAYEFTTQLKPDLIIVSGTRLIKERMLSIEPAVGILNLHTGLSPFIKGGPNCTNWCIATKQYHLIGNTIMWIDLGIDSGNILTTELTKFEGDENLTGIHIKLMEHAHDLYLKAIEFLKNNGESNISQMSVGAGKTYYTKDWKLKNKFNLLQNLNEFRAKIKSGEIKTLQKSVKIVFLDTDNMQK